MLYAAMLNVCTCPSRFLLTIKNNPGRNYSLLLTKTEIPIFTSRSKDEENNSSYGHAVYQLDLHYGASRF